MRKEKGWMPGDIFWCMRSVIGVDESRERERNVHRS
jgi:hypothetical protein